MVDAASSFPSADPSESSSSAPNRPHALDLREHEPQSTHYFSSMPTSATSSIRAMYTSAVASGSSTPGVVENVREDGQGEGSALLGSAARASTGISEEGYGAVSGGPDPGASVRPSLYTQISILTCLMSQEQEQDRKDERPTRQCMPSCDTIYPPLLGYPNITYHCVSFSVLFFDPVYMLKNSL